MRILYPEEKPRKKTDKDKVLGVYINIGNVAVLLTFFAMLNNSPLYHLTYDIALKAFLSFATVLLFSPRNARE